MEQNITKYRRDLHQIPEVAFKEYKTSKYLKEKLTSFGYKPFSLLETDVIVYIDLGFKETIAFRSDIDALPVHEDNDIEFKSTHEGYMHACGHDGHMAMLLGFAEYLSKNLDKLTKNILLIFQPAEESIGGAKLLCDKGLMKDRNVSAVFGIHLYPELDEGIIASRPGEFMAMTCEVDIEILGKATHGAMPQFGVDSNLIMSKLLIDLQTIQTRNVSPMEYTILTFGKMEGGFVRNVISDKSRLEGTLRAFNKETFNGMLDKIKQVAKGYEHAYDCKININHTEGYLAVDNDKELYKRFRNATKDYPYHEFDKPLMIAEDFSFYQQDAPGVFYYVGIKNEELGFTQSLHHSKFNFSEKALMIGLDTYKKMLNEMQAIKKDD